MKSIFKPVVAAMLLFSVSAQARQIEFSQAASGETVEFTYRWDDRFGRPDGVIMSVLKQDIDAHLNDPKMKIRPKALAGWLFEHVRQEAARLSTDGYSITVSNNDGMVSIQGKGIDQKVLNDRVEQVKAINQRALEHLESNSYFMLVDGEIRLDYKEIVDTSTSLLGPVASIMTDTRVSTRENIERYLPFLQNIPYDRLDGDEEFGLYTPMHMLITNKGDCESKQLALATMIRSQYPTADMIMLGLVDHMVIGVAIAPQVGDQTFMHQGRLYVLMDATGPALSKPGHLSEREVKRLSAGEGIVFPI
ncbi:hypothetical protein P5704_023790 (plasmid) [Pseudomonas sp. FeN3W]|nr:hypothetical protein P5704_023790 [Pseudomonas sp. FeN3W]